MGGRAITSYMVTKRTEHIADSLPLYWEDIRDRVTVCCTMENQHHSDKRLPLFRTLPLYHWEIIVDPVIEPIDFKNSLDGIERIMVGGKSGREIQPCKYEWILDVPCLCAEARMEFHFIQTGGNFFVNEKNKLSCKLQITQAVKAGIGISV